MTEGWRDVRLPGDLCAAAEKQYVKQYANVEELLTFILRYLTGAEATRLDQSELQMVEARLKDLGYM